MKYPKITYTAAVAADQRAALTSSSQSKSRHRWLKPVPLIAILVMLLVVAGGFTWFVIGSNSRTGLSPSNLTATAQARTYTRATQTALAKTLTPSSSPTVDPTQQAMQNEYSNIMKSKPTIVGFQASEQWSTTADKTCTFDNPDAYHAVIKTKNQYTRCMAANTKFKNFALQVTMNINGGAGGVIFRDNSNGTYYRFAFNQSDPNALTYSIYLCNSDCTTDAVGTGAPLASDPVNVDQTKPITLTIIAKDDNIDLYINKTFLKHINDRTSLSGQIGVFAASLGTDTDVTFSNLKVWSLDT